MKTNIALPPIDERLTLAEVEELTGLKRHTIRYRLNRGRFPRPIKVDGYHPFYLRKEVEEYIAKRQRELVKNARMSVRDSAYLPSDKQK